MGRDPFDVELLQGASHLAQLRLGSIPMMNGPRRDLKYVRFIGVDRYRPSMLLDITTQLPQVLLRGIMPYEARCQLRSGVIDHPDQIELLAPPFQPVVFMVSHCTN